MEGDSIVTGCVCVWVWVFVSGLLKTHNLSFQDCESLQAVFDKDNCTNVLRAQPRSSFLPQSLSCPLSLSLSFFYSVPPVVCLQVVGGYSSAFPALSGGSECVSERRSSLAQESRGR